MNPCFVAPCPETAVCVADAPTGPFCGGIAGIKCAGHATCVDNPADSCDPTHGGADCSGVCVCPPNTLLCIKGTHWDGSASVCSCVPDAPTGACTTDADCRLSDNYCGGCSCEALGPGQAPTTCSTPVNCLVEPCGGKVAKCEAGQCVAAAKPVGVACGKNTCGAGSYCCNASCGICAPIGNVCIQIACPPAN